MKLIFALVVAAAAGMAPMVHAAAPAPAVQGVPDAARVKAAQDLMQAMQAEKLMRTTAGSSHYASEQQRKAVFDKLEKVPPAEIYRRLSVPVARLVSTETALEMTKFYGTSYGQRVLHEKYNSGPSYGDRVIKASKEEQAALKRPEFMKADKELRAAEDAIGHETFVLLSQIIK